MKKIYLGIILLTMAVVMIGCGKKEENTAASAPTEREIIIEPSAETEEETSYHPTLSYDTTTGAGDIVDIPLGEEESANTVESIAATEVYKKYKWTDEQKALEEYAYWLEAPEDTGYEDGEDNGANWANHARISKYVPMPTEQLYGGTDDLWKFLRANGIQDVFVIDDPDTLEESENFYRWESTYNGGSIMTYYNKNTKTFTFEMK